METLCFNGYYAKRFARSKEFCNEKLEAVFDRQLKSFCDHPSQQDTLRLTSRSRNTGFVPHENLLRLS
jgi:hypothetical protein